MSWTNWAGTVTVHPAATVAPVSPEAVASAVREARDGVHFYRAAA